MRDLRPLLPLFLLLAACGQAGPLYLPDEEHDPAMPSPTPAVKVTSTDAPLPADGVPDAPASDASPTP